MYTNATAAFLDELAAVVSGRRVLEVFAGNGDVARDLSARGIDVTATSRPVTQLRPRVSDGVVRMYAEEAIRLLGPSADVLLMCWPEANSDAVRAALDWGDARDIIFVGEITEPEGEFLGGCATDLYFAVTQETSRIASYQSRSPGERASVRRLDPVFALTYREHGFRAVAEAAGEDAEGCIRRLHPRWMQKKRGYMPGPGPALRRNPGPPGF